MMKEKLELTICTFEQRLKQLKFSGVTTQSEYNRIEKELVSTIKNYICNTYGLNTKQAEVVYVFALNDVGRHMSSSALVYNIEKYADFISRFQRC